MGSKCVSYIEFYKRIPFLGVLCQLQQTVTETNQELRVVVLGAEDESPVVGKFV